MRSRGKGNVRNMSDIVRVISNVKGVPAFWLGIFIGSMNGEPVFSSL